MVLHSGISVSKDVNPEAQLDPSTNVQEHSPDAPTMTSNSYVQRKQEPAEVTASSEG